MRHYLSFFIVCCCLACFGPVMSYAQDTSLFEPSIPREACEAIQNGQWGTVEEILKPAATGENPPESVHYWYGVAAYYQKNYLVSIQHFQAALTLNPDCPVAAQYCARACGSGLISQDTAITTMDQLLKTWQDDPIVLQQAAKLRLEQYRRCYHKDRSSALLLLLEGRDYLQKAAAIDPANAAIHLQLTEIYTQMETYPQAIEHLLIADRLEPLGCEAYIMLAQLYGETEQFSLAADAFETAMELAPAQSGKLEWDLGECLLKARRGEEAMEVFRGIFSRDNMNRKVRFMLGRAAYMAGDYATALFGFRESYLRDQNPEALIWSARCAYDLEQDELAVTLADQAFEEAEKNENIDPEADWYFVRGRALWQLGQKNKAVGDLETAFLYDPENAEAAKWAIYAFRSINDPYGVVRIAKQYGLSNDPYEGMEIIRQVQKTWRFFTPGKDYRGKKYSGGLVGYTTLAIAELYDAMGQYKSASILLQNIGWNSQGTVSSWASWLRVRAGEVQEADAMFKALLERGSTEYRVQLALYGLVYTSLYRKDAKAAVSYMDSIKEERFTHNKQTVYHWADVFAGKDGAVEALDPYDLLGIYTQTFNGWKLNRGIVVDALLANSALCRTVPVIERKDRILRVNSILLQDWDSIDKIRKIPPSIQNLTLVILREGREFEVNVDLSAARKMVAESLQNMEVDS